MLAAFARTVRVVTSRTILTRRYSSRWWQRIVQCMGGIPVYQRRAVGTERLNMATFQEDATEKVKPVSWSMWRGCVADNCAYQRVMQYNR